MRHFLAVYQVTADVRFSNVDKFSNVYKSSNGAYLNLATVLEPMHGFLYNFKTRQRDLNKVSLPIMTSSRLPSPGKACQKMVVFNYSDFERL